MAKRTANRTHKRAEKPKRRRFMGGPSRSAIHLSGTDDCIPLV
jgi:hypothetical protein